MINEIKNKIENELNRFINKIDRSYSLSRISPLLYYHIKEFLLRTGKRLRPVLFVIGYLGFAEKARSGIYTSALSFELLHDFLLIHDDIIDKSDMRRGKPSMHRALNKALVRYKDAKFTGQDLSLVIGDIVYAIAIDAFLSVKEDGRRKEDALKKFLEGAVYTGCGEFTELLNGVRDIKKISREDIYKIYDLKTAHYSFVSPLASGAALAGADKDEIAKLSRYGICLGRAFQIKDDILGIFGKEEKTGKSPLTDLREAKKTLLIWYAYKHSAKKERFVIKKALGKPNLDNAGLSKVRRIIISTGSLDYAKKEISAFLKKGEGLLASSAISPAYKISLSSYSSQLLRL